jgi:diguanylate cyclase (GGDEF)-like protein/putative nucleotidyltransferase with HDIG domain
VLAIVAESSCWAVGAQECVIWEYREDERVLAERSYFSTAQTAYTPVGRVQLDESPVLRAILDGGVAVEETISSATLHPLSRAVMDEWHEKSRLSAPLMFEGRAIGMMVLIETEIERHYRPDEIALVQALAEQAAVAVENARHREQLERATAQLESQLELRRVLLELSGSLIAVHDPHDVFARIATLVKRVVDNDCLEIRLIDAETEELYCAYASDAIPEYVENWRASLDVGVSGWVVRHNEAQLVNDMPADPRVGVVPGTEAEPQASIIVPLTVGGTVIGVLAIDRMGGRTFAEHELEPARLFANLAAVAIQNARQYEDVKRVHTSNLRTLCAALNAKDHYTLGHTARVAAYLVLLCRELGWPDEAVHTIGEAAYLHDIGKIAISDRILTKVGKLNDREWQLMRRHPVLSAEIVRPLYDDDVVAGVRHHHERYDGRGYPDGLAGEDIPPIARAMCVVDSYDAMSFERPYHRGLSYTQCRAEIERCKGSQFDPVMADAFLRVLERLAATRARALAIGERIAAEIDGDEHAALVATGTTDDKAYRHVAAQLRAARDAEPGVRFIETMALRDDRVIFVCEAEEDEAQRSHLGDEVVGDEEVGHTLAGERPDICVVAADEFGVYISAMAPIRQRDGAIVGAVSVDFSAYEDAEAGGLFADSTSALTGLLQGAADRVTRAELDATTDTLTGLANHRHFHERLADELAQAQESGRELSLLLCDVDRFAAFNDRLGHTKGDEALRTVGQLLERSVRGADLCARVGGDEFALVLADVGAERALEVAEALPGAVGAAGIVGSAAPLTLSVGLATFPWDAVDKDALLDKARWAVSLAKHRGGDCVVQFADRQEGHFETGRDQAVDYLSVMAELADAKMLYGEKHSGAVARLASALAVDLDLGEAEAADAGTAARLCDIGHVAVPDDVLSKPGRLSDDEWQLICEHPRAGERLLRRMKGLDAVADAVAYHHERFDGTGYPAQLKGEAIPVIARIVAVASTFQALVNRRPYRLERSHEDALAEMRRCAGSQFDPAVVAALERVLSYAEGVSWVSPAAG